MIPYIKHLTANEYNYVTDRDRAVKGERGREGKRGVNKGVHCSTHVYANYIITYSLFNNRLEDVASMRFTQMPLPTQTQPLLICTTTTIRPPDPPVKDNANVQWYTILYM